jgi:GntR family transcriptional regulator
MSTNSPVYLDIAEALRKEVARRRLAPHSRLPSEPELVRKYRVARATVRRALAQLQSEGLVYTKQGVGSFVAEPRVDQDLDQLFSFTEFMVYRHIRPGSKLLAAEVQRIKAPDSPILYYLGLKSGDRVIYVRRLRLGSGEPLVIANTWLPEARFPDFLKQDLEHESVYEIMRKLNHKPTDAVQTFEAVTLDREVAGLLTVPPGSAALLIRRVGYASGIPVEYAIDYYRGDRTKFRVRLGLLEQRITDRIRDDHIAI